MSALQLDESELLDTSSAVPIPEPVTEATKEATKEVTKNPEPTKDATKKHKKDTKKTPVTRKRRTLDGLHLDESKIPESSKLPSPEPRVIGKRHRRASEGKTGFPFRSIRKLARRGGVKRISKTALTAAMTYADDFVRKTVELAIAYLESGDKERQTCRTKDVLQAFRMMGCSLFGAEDLG
jgi:histone H3/H4